MSIIPNPEDYETTAPTRYPWQQYQGNTTKDPTATGPLVLALYGRDFSVSGASFVAQLHVRARITTTKVTTLLRAHNGKAAILFRFYGKQATRPSLPSIPQVAEQQDTQNSNQQEAEENNYVCEYPGCGGTVHPYAWQQGVRECTYKPFSPHTGGAPKGFSLGLSFALTHRQEVPYIPAGSNAQPEDLPQLRILNLLHPVTNTPNGPYTTDQLPKDENAAD